MKRNILDLYPQYKTNDDKSSAVGIERCEKTQVMSYDIKYNADIQLLKDTFKTFNPKIQDLKQHINHVDDLTKDRKMLFSALSPIVPIRRIASLEDNINDGNYARACGLVALAVANLPEDCRDIENAYKQIFKKAKPRYDYKNYQHSFSFFRGTLFEDFLKLKGRMGKVISKKLYSADTPFYDTKPGQILCKLFNILENDVVPSDIKDIKGRDVFARSFKGNTIQKILGNAMLRTSKIGIYVLSILELPSIIKSFVKPKNKENRVKSGSKQLIKSTINVTSILSGIGVGGAILARRFGAVGSLIGMGVGSVIGSYVSKKIRNIVDQF